MYNNSYFQKLLNNVQNGANNQKVSVVDQKKKTSSNNVETQQQQIPENINVMIKTSYGGGGFSGASQTTNNNSGAYVINNQNPNSVLHSNVISKALAQQKIRKFRQNQAQAQLRGFSEAHQQEHSFSQDLTQASTDPLNHTTNPSGDINSSVINVATHHFDPSTNNSQ